ncbi:dolichol kinase [Sporothrix epigloea]|uniref:dolichol kinase n=1 Tax=Sporothrix epigloea TaxID=1892477 RepID=A0ABP0DAT4_9PEZI
MLAAADENHASEGFLSSGSSSSSSSGNARRRSNVNNSFERWQSIPNSSEPPSMQPVKSSRVPSEAKPPHPSAAPDFNVQGESLRQLNRSPHPYQHQYIDLPHAAHHTATLSQAQTSLPTETCPQVPPQTNNQSSTTPIPISTSGMPLSPVASSYFSKDSVPGSDSGTEADDEHFLKGLPAPRSRPHKGLRGMSKASLAASTPLRREFLQECSDGGDEDDIEISKRQDGYAGRDDESPAASIDHTLEQEGDFYGRNTRKRHSTGSTAILPLALLRRIKGQLDDDVAAYHNSFSVWPGHSIFERNRQRREIVRRLTEVLLLVVMAALVFSKPMVWSLAGFWSHELRTTGTFLMISLFFYPWRLAGRVSDGVVEGRSFVAYIRRRLKGLRHLRIPTSFDPAPLLYPLALPILVSFLLVGPTLHAAPIINMVLSLCTLPPALFPYDVPSHSVYNTTQWLVTLMPMTVAVQNATRPKALVLDHIFSPDLSSARYPILLLESSALLYPLHVSLCNVLRDVAATSLLPAELQLLSVALINLLMLASSPQTIILRAMLWIGGVGLLIFGGHTVRWGITLARIPCWRFRRVELDTASNRATTSLWMYLSPMFFFKCVGAELKSLRHARLEAMYGLGGDRGHSDLSAGDSDSLAHTSGGERKRRARAHSAAAALATAPTFGEKADLQPDFALLAGTLPPKRVNKGPRITHTPSGRKKRATSPTVRALFSLTYEQAMRRKWLYAGYLYLCIAALILVGIRPYVASHALQGCDPFGWALGYLFSDVDWIRLEVVKANLESWVCLPARTTMANCQYGRLGRLDGPVLDVQDIRPCPSCGSGWVEYNRQLWFGAASTRLLLAGYWVVVLLFGLAVVFTLSPVYEVDTRRKVFHFMMVAMMLPATFVDPTYTALALILVLAVFLLLDVLRASQLPPLSRPIAMFLTPYVDGRDLRGPVVISHIFLLIGCAIPLWLSLAALPRAPLAVPNDSSADSSQCTKGWEVPSRDISMLAGVLCVGLGDAAASLIGRRWGCRKWLWGGGKSLEGSAAFAVAVFLGLMLANAWLRIGGWPIKGQENLPVLADVGRKLTRPRSFAFWQPLAPLIASLVSKLPPFLQRSMAWLGTTAAQSVAPRAALCASMASMTEAVLTGGNDNVVVPVILWTCVKSFEL